jgi:hypothetical protein
MITSTVIYYLIVLIDTFNRWVYGDDNLRLLSVYGIITVSWEK